MDINNIDLKQLKLLIKLLKDEGVTSFSHNGLKIQFDTLQELTPQIQDIKEIEVKGDKDPSDEEILYWSSGK
jgi:hypothetical protein